MMMIRKIFVLLLFLPFACNINAQDDDFGLWFALNTEYGIFKKIDLKVNGSLRTFNNTSQVDQTFLEAGMEYKFAKNFSVEGFYRLINTIEDDGNYYYRHRLHF